MSSVCLRGPGAGADVDSSLAIGTQKPATNFQEIGYTKSMVSPSLPVVIRHSCSRLH